VVAVLGAIQFRGLPRVRAGIGWVVAQRDLLRYYLASFIAIMGAYQLTLLLIAGLGTPADVGALRAAQVVLGPLNLLGYALSAFAVAEISRRRLGGRRGIQAAAALSALLLLATLAWGVVLLLLPDSAGAALLGDTWTTAEAVLPASLLGLVAIALGFGASLLMIALGFAKETFRINIMLAPGFLVLGLVGLEVAGAPGAALGLSLAQVFVAPAIWWRVVVLVRRGERGSDQGDADEDPAFGPA
jgi:O-antigen/teichoic acid export membrane protein